MSSPRGSGKLIDTEESDVLVELDLEELALDDDVLDLSRSRSLGPSSVTSPRGSSTPNSTTRRGSLVPLQQKASQGFRALVDEAVLSRKLARSCSANVISPIDASRATQHGSGEALRTNTSSVVQSSIFGRALGSSSLTPSPSPLRNSLMGIAIADIATPLAFTAARSSSSTVASAVVSPHTQHWTEGGTIFNHGSRSNSNSNSVTNSTSVSPSPATLSSPTPPPIPLATPPVRGSRAYYLNQRRHKAITAAVEKAGISSSPEADDSQPGSRARTTPHR